MNDALPGQVPEGWKRYYLYPWGCSMLGGFLGGTAQILIREFGSAGACGALFCDHAGWASFLGAGIGLVLGIVVTLVMLLRESEDAARRNWQLWGAAGFLLCAAAAFGLAGTITSGRIWMI